MVPNSNAKRAHLPTACMTSGPKMFVLTYQGSILGDGIDGVLDNRLSVHRFTDSRDFLMLHCIKKQDRNSQVSEYGDILMLCSSMIGTYGSMIGTYNLTDYHMLDLGSLIDTCRKHVVFYFYNVVLALSWPLSTPVIILVVGLNREMFHLVNILRIMKKFVSSSIYTRN